MTAKKTDPLEKLIEKRIREALDKPDLTTRELVSVLTLASKHIEDKKKASEKSAKSTKFFKG